MAYKEKCIQNFKQGFWKEVLISTFRLSRPEGKQGVDLWGWEKLLAAGTIGHIVRGELPPPIRQNKVPEPSRAMIWTHKI